MPRRFSQHHRAVAGELQDDVAGGLALHLDRLVDHLRIGSYDVL